MIVTQGQALNFAPQALAETMPLAASTGYFYPEQGVPLLNQFALYGQMYRAQPWLATVVDKIASSGSRLTFNVWDNTGSGEKRLDAESPYSRLWVRPCPTMPPFSFWRWTFSTYEVYGEAFWLKLRNDDTRQVEGLYPMHPSRTIVQRDKDTGDLTYIFSLGVAQAGLLKVPESEVVPFLRYNPDNMMRGLSRVEPLRSTLYNEDASRRAIESWWKRGARPSLMISAPAALSDGAYNRLSAMVGKVHGGADQMGGTLVLEEGAKPVPVQLSAEEMQYIQSRVLNREEVCGVYDVPPPAIHILDRATFSNITEQSRMLYRDTMAPRLEDVESTVDHYLRPDFATDGVVEGRFALDEVLRGDFETRANATSQLVQSGIMKPSEARPLFDLDDAGPIADRLYANSTIQELGAPAEQIRITAGTTANPVPDTPAEDEELQAAEQDAARAQSHVQQDQPTRSASVTRRRRNREEARRLARHGKWHANDEDPAEAGPSSD